MNRFLKAFIAVSVLLNLLLAGIVIGNFCHHFVGQSKHVTVQEIAQALPAGKRGNLEDGIERADQNISGLRQQLADARKKAAEILKAEPFNKEAYLAQAQQIQQVRGRIVQRMNEAVIEIAVQSDAKERAAIAAALFP